MKPIRSLIPIILIASTVAVSPAPAETRAVSYADLDLSTPAGQAMLDRRISWAIVQVCGGPYPADLQGRREVTRCRHEAAANVQAQRNDAFAQAQSNRIQLSSRR